MSKSIPNVPKYILWGTTKSIRLRRIASMAVLLTGAITNIILDPILIFGYFGIPAMGMAGAAIATVVGQCAAATVGIILNIKWNKKGDPG